MPDQNEKRKPLLVIGLEKGLFQDGHPARGRIAKQLEEAGFESTIIVFAKQKFDERITPNLRVISTNSWNKFFYVTDALRIVWKLRKQKFAVITSQDPTETGLVAYLASKFLNSALAIQDHGYHFHGNYYRQESWLNQFRYLFARFIVTRADAIRVVSQRTEEALIKLGVPRERIVRFPVVLNENFKLQTAKSNLVNSEQGAVNSDQWTVTDDAQGSARYEIQNTKYFLVVCRFVPIKRIDLAIHAFSIFAKQNPDVNLKIVGAGPLEDQVKRWIADFDLHSRVEIIPWTNDLAELYRNAIATLITSDREGFGMTAVESLACSTPVIMTDVGCAEEVVKNSENGIIVPVGDVVALANAMVSVLGKSLFVVRSSMFASEASMKVFLLSAISHQLSAKKKEDEDFWKFSEGAHENRFDEEKQSMINQQNSEEKVKMLFLTQKINQDDDDLAFTILWIKEFIRQGVDVEVICLEKGAFDGSFPVHSLGKEKGYGKIRRIFEFYKIIISLKYNRVFVHMNTEYVTLGGWYWALRRIPIYLWFTHYVMHVHVFLSGLLCRRMFAATKQSLPQYEGRTKKVVLGHGIDLDFWLQEAETIRGSDDETKYNLLTVHRLCRSKRLELGILALKHLPEKYNLTIYGRDVEKEYVEELKALVAKESLESRVKFMGPVPMHQLKQVYPKHRLMVNMASETIDKTMVEAMLFGIYPITTKGNSNAIGLPVSIQNDDPKEMADFILAEKWKDYDIEYLRDIIKAKHSLPALIANMNKYIKPGN